MGNVSVLSADEDRPPRRLARHADAAPTLPRPMTSFIGREREIAAVLEMLARDDVRLLTLTGPGGVGKTRLALRVAGTATGFPDGAGFVDLASLYDPAAVAPAIGRALGIRPAGDQPVDAGIAMFLQDRRALLVLDNFEQVLEAGTLVAELLATCPLLTILVTSRVALRLTGEHRFGVPPLSLPDVSVDRSPDRLFGAEAVRLFVDRARAAAPDFRLTDATAADVAAICARLDGVPLALELAAARMSVFSPADMLKRLDEHLLVLAEGPRDAPERLRSMHDSIAWSYDLLSPGEQVLFRQLGAFVGTWTLDAAEAVAGAVDDASRHRMLEQLATLVEASLVRRQPDDDGETVYRMLVPIREFAEELLDRSDEAEAINVRHLAFITGLVEQAEVALYHPDGLRRIAHLRILGANIPKAIAWAEHHGHAEEMMRLAGALNVYGNVHVHVQEGRRLAERAAEVGRALASPRLVKTLVSLAAIGYVMGDQAFARVTCDEALALIDARTDAHTRYKTHAWDGVLALRDGDTDRAITAQKQALAVLRSVPEVDWAALAESTTLGHLGNIAIGRGDIDGAERWFEQALDCQRAIGCTPGTSHIIANHPIVGLGDVARARGDLPLALRRYGEALSLAARFGDYIRIGYIMGGVAATLAAAGQWQQASRLFGATQAYHALIGLHFDLETMDRQRALGLPEPWLRAGESFGAGQPLRDALWGDREVPMPPVPNPAEAATLWEAGRALDIEAAVAEALAADLSQPVRAPEAAGGLSAREVEVLRLLTEGRIDQEIADALFISRRTAATHIGHIYDKLGVSSRAAAAAWAVRNGLA
jgi:predicted ATPase/DNA-binding CsgD family transcriptional regulator